MRDLTNILRMHAQVERPTFAQLRSIGMTVVTATGRTVYQRPTTFDLADPMGYFVTEIVRRVNEEKELGEWTSYQSHGQRPNNPRVGAVPEPLGLPGPPMTPAERRLAGKESPKTSTGDRICWNYNSHLGRSDPDCSRAREFYKNFDQLSCAIKISLANRYGFEKRGKLSVASVSDTIKNLRQAALQESNRNRSLQQRGATPILMLIPPEGRQDQHFAPNAARGRLR